MRDAERAETMECDIFFQLKANLTLPPSVVAYTRIETLQQF